MVRNVLAVKFCVDADLLAPFEAGLKTVIGKIITKGYSDIVLAGMG